MEKREKSGKEMSSRTRMRKEGMDVETLVHMLHTVGSLCIHQPIQVEDVVGSIMAAEGAGGNMSCVAVSKLCSSSTEVDVCVLTDS